jgi:hypothetical protein
MPHHELKVCIPVDKVPNVMVLIEELVFPPVLMASGCIVTQQITDGPAEGIARQDAP